MGKRRHLSGAELLQYRKEQREQQKKKQKLGNSVNRRLEKYNRIAEAVKKAKEEQKEC